MKYQLIYSNKRKTVALQIKHGEVVVRAPSYVDKHIIEDFVLKKQAWIERHLVKSQERLTVSFSYQQGQELFISGALKSFHFDYANDDSVIETDSSLTLLFKIMPEQSTISPQQLKQRLDAWMCQQVDSYLASHLAKFAENLGVSYKNVKVRHYRTRWGSCNSRKQLTFNSLLAMVPKSVFDYVIVHELCHLVHMNHSAEFWQLVANQQPHFKQQKNWLKTHQCSLKI